MLNNVISIFESGAAAAGDFESIATVTVGSGGAADVQFTSIPSGFAHLQIRGLASVVSGGDSLDMQLNGDTGNNYARHTIYGDGATAAAFAGSSIAFMRAGFIGQFGSSKFGAFVVDILDYANTNKYKTMRSLSGGDNNGSGEVSLRSGLWQNTNAITSIKFYAAGNLAQYSHFALYGIKSA